MPCVSVDPQRVRQILFNLLSNAYKYTERGTVTIRVGWQDGTLTLSVADTGKGISKEDHPRILQPFVQLVDKNHRDGTGLGLPICQKLATLMGGELKIASEVGVGSTFTVTFHNVKTVAAPPSHSERTRNSLHPKAK
jgi:signal transduction histidine kinase